MTLAVVAAVLAAGACCVGRSRRRARVLAVVMAVACLPVVAETLGWTLAPVLLAASMALMVGARRREPADRGMDAHRAVGGILMAGMLLTGMHGAETDVGASHAHGADVTAVLAVGTLGYLAWTVGVAARRTRAGHRSARLPRLEAAAMGAMAAAMGAAHAVPPLAVFAGG